MAKKKSTLPSFKKSDIPKIDVTLIGTDGYAKRVGGATFVWMWGPEGKFTDNPSVKVFKNKRNAGNDVLYVRRFTQKRIYRDIDELKRVELKNLDNVLILGATGYSSLSAEQAKQWGFLPGAYEAASRLILTRIMEAIKRAFPACSLIIADGASDMGIDRSIIQAAQALNIPHIGFSCPEYAFYVTDDDSPLFIATNKHDYSDEFVHFLQILICMNGRTQAFNHDMLAAMRYEKKLILANILKAISDNTGPAAYTSDGHIEDALTTFCEIFPELAGAATKSYDELELYVIEKVLTWCRHLLPPELAYAV